MHEKGHLRRVLGLTFGLAAVVGSIIGQGILRSPGIVAEATGSGAVIIGLWVAGALVTCLFALPFTELGAAMPKAGGPYAFVRRAYGERAGVVAALAIATSYFAAVAYLAYVVGEFFVRLGVGGGAISPMVFAFGTLAVFGAINATSTRICGASQVACSAIKGVVLLGLVVLLFAAPGAAPQPDAKLLNDGWLPMGTAIVVILTTYAGWYSIVFFGEEIKDPGRQVPRAMFGGILGVAALYFVINLAMLHVMTPEQMAGSNLAAADAAGIVFGPNGDVLLTIFGVLSVGAITNLAIMTSVRVAYSIARAGILPRSLAEVGGNGTPLRALALVLASAGLMLLTDSYLALVSLGETVFIPVLIACYYAVIVLRRKEPDLPRPFKVPFYPWSIHASVILQTILLAVFIAQDPVYALAGFALVAVLWLLLEGVARLRGMTLAASLEPEDI